MTSNKNLMTIRFYPPLSTIFPRFPLGPQAALPKAKSQKLRACPPPSISYKMYFSPLTPPKTTIFLSADIRILYKMYNRFLMKGTIKKWQDKPAIVKLLS